MGDTLGKGDKFKAAFGVITDNSLGAKKQDVRTQLDDVSVEIDNLPATVPAASTAHLRKTLGELRTAVGDPKFAGKSNKEGYKICETTEKGASRLSKAAAALAESEKRLPELKNLVASGSDKDLKKLDDMVKKMGDKAKSSKDQGFMIAAIRARYDVDEMSGELTSGALPRLYAVLRMVPPEHARLNDKLKRIHREKPEGTSTAMGGQMTLNAGLSNRDNITDKYNNSEGKRLKLNDFDATSLHELGHTVDEAYKFMESKRGQAAFGGWEDSSLEDVTALVAAEIKKSLTSTPLDDKKLAWIAKQALISPRGLDGIDQSIINGNIQKDELSGFKAMSEQDWLRENAVDFADRAVAEFLQSAKMPLDMSVLNPWVKTTDPDALKAWSDHADGTVERKVVNKVIDAMITYGRAPRRAADVVREALAELDSLEEDMPDPTAIADIKKDIWVIRATKMAKEFWNQPSSEIEAAALNGKVYQFNQAHWWKYDVGARAIRVSDYQFRAPLEWFAEVYAVFKLKKLAKSHPCYALIDGITTVQM